MQELFDYLQNDLLTDARFASFLTDDMRARITDAQTMLTDAVTQLRGSNYSRLVLTTTLPGESDETSAFITQAFHLAGSRRRHDRGLLPHRQQRHGLRDGKQLRQRAAAHHAPDGGVDLPCRRVHVPLARHSGAARADRAVRRVHHRHGRRIAGAGDLLPCAADRRVHPHGCDDRLRHPLHELLPRDARASMCATRSSPPTAAASTRCSPPARSWCSSRRSSGNFRQPDHRAEICRTISIGAFSAIILILLFLPGMLALLDRWVLPRDLRRRLYPPKAPKPPRPPKPPKAARASWP